MLVLLVGPPASGKDAVTDKLLSSSQGYVHFKPLKVPATVDRNLTQYVEIDVREFEHLYQHGELIDAASRYGKPYRFDRARLTSLKPRIELQLFTWPIKPRSPAFVQLSRQCS